MNITLSLGKERILDQNSCLIFVHYFLKSAAILRASSMEGMNDTDLNNPKSSFFSFCFFGIIYDKKDALELSIRLKQ